jgi:glycosyltransferase involved in cell wall biosynthesis
MATPGPYRFGFVLTTGSGNRTRYLNLRRYAERDPEVECVWAPDPGARGPDHLAGVPARLRARLGPVLRAAPVLRQLSRLDAVMFHAFEAYVLAALRSVVAPRPALVWHRDDPPSADPAFWLQYGLRARSRRRARLRFAVDRWCAGRVALFLAWSRWSADALARDCGVPAERIQVVHVGVDLELWTCAPRAAARARPKILFVGADFVRKGGDLLVDVYRRRWAGAAELHLVTRGAPADLPPGAVVHDDLEPNDARLRRLYADADLFVLPTRGDMSSFAALEAMASGVPVVASDVGGIPDLVREGETGFLVPPGDGDRLADRVQLLLDDPDRRRRMGAQGRALVEREYSAALNVPRILGLMKATADAARPGPAPGRR